MSALDAIKISENKGRRALTLWFLTALVLSAVANAHHAVLNRDASVIGAAWAAVLGATPAVLWAGSAHIVAVDRRRLAVGGVFLVGGALAAVQSYGALYWSAENAGLTLPALFPVLVDVLGGAAGYFAITSGQEAPRAAEEPVVAEKAAEKTEKPPRVVSGVVAARSGRPSGPETQKERGYVVYARLRDEGLAHTDITSTVIAEEVGMHSAKVRQFRPEWEQRYEEVHSVLQMASA